MTKLRNTWVNTADLQIDPQVQGVRRESRVQEMAMNWDERAVNTVTISQRRDDSLFVIDGQHRAAAALERKIPVQRDGKTEWKPEPVTKLWAQVHTGLSLADEAQMYVLLNNTKVPSAVDRIAVAAVGGDPIAERLVATAAKYGWYLKRNPKINAAQALYKIANWDEEGEILDRTFHIITEAWQHDVEATRSDIVDGLARLIHRWPAVDDNRLARVLGKATPSTVLSSVAQMRPTYKARARMMAIVGLHDRGLSEARKLAI